MSGPRPGDVRRQSIRVALGAAVAVAIVYAAISVAVVVLVTRDLTHQIDDRLVSFLGSPGLTSDGSGGFRPVGEAVRDEDRPFAAPILIWRISADGSRTYVGPSDYAVDLPASFASISDPQTVTINGAELRIAGRRIDSSYFLVAQTTGTVTDARTTLVVAEVLIAPFLLLLVFAGSVLVGRRVAMPIERARQRQLEFTADASHELRTPLSVIEAQTSLALAQERSSDWYRTAFGRIDHESRRMRRLIEDLLWLARFDATRVPAGSEPVDIGILAQAAADRFAVVAEARRLSLGLHVPAESLVVTAPAEWLDRLIGVLLDNACKYAPDGGSVDVRANADRGRIVLTVDDSGPGVPESERTRIFDRFHRATDARSGAGLGLAIGDAIVRATGGQWRIGTAPAGGARMTVSWPRSFPGVREDTPRPAVGAARDA